MEFQRIEKELLVSRNTTFEDKLKDFSVWFKTFENLPLKAQLKKDFRKQSQLRYYTASDYDRCYELFSNFTTMKNAKR